MRPTICSVRTGSTRSASILSWPGRAVPRPAFTETSILKPIWRSHFSTDARWCGRAPGSRPKSNAARRIQKRGCWPSSTLPRLVSQDLVRGLLVHRCFAGGQANDPVRQAAVVHLAKIRAMVQDLAQQANLQDPQKFAQIWHMLMKGSIVSACEGNRNAAREAKQAARIIIHNWQSR